MIKNQIKVGAIISYLQMIISISIGLIYTPMMIRFLGQSEYGLYNTVASTISMLSILRLGFNNSYIRYFSIYNIKNDTQSISKLNGTFLLLFSIIGVISFICGIYLTNNLDIIFSKGLTLSEYKIAKVLMFLLTINLSISFPMSVFSNIISANEKFIYLKSLEIIRTIFGPLVSLPLLLAGKGSIGVVSTTLIISIIIDLLYIYYVLNVLKNKFIFKIPEKWILKDLIIYTFFIALELIVDQINWNIDKVLLGRFKGTLMVAIYSVGYSLYTYYQNFSIIISGMFIPRVHKIINNITDRQIKREELTNLFVKVGRIQFLILSLIATGVIFFGKFFIIRIWAGIEYEQSYPIAILLILSASVALIQNLGIEIQRAEYLHQFRSLVYIVMSFINLGLSIYLCQILGAIGCALGTSISLIIANGIIMNIYYQKKCNIDILYFWKNIGELSLGLIIPIIAGIIMKFFINSEFLIIYIIKIVLYIIIYSFSMWKIGINEYEKEQFYLLLSKICKIIHIKYFFRGDINDSNN